MPWSRDVVVLVPADSAELASILQITYGPESYVAFAISSVSDKKGFSYVAPRIIFNQEALADRTDESAAAILAHELLHVATRGHSGPFVPIFVEEGFAELVGRSTDPDALSFLSSEIAAGLFDRRLPREDQFRIGDSFSIFRSYQEGLSAVRFFVDRFGLRRFVRFYLELGRRRVAAGTQRFHVEDAMRKTIGMGLGRFERAWADSLSG